MQRKPLWDRLLLECQIQEWGNLLHWSSPIKPPPGEFKLVTRTGKSYPILVQAYIERK